MEWKSLRIAVENVQAFSGRGVKAFAKLRGKMAGLLELSGKAACAIVELKRLGAHSAVIYPQVIAPRLAQIYDLPKHGFSPPEIVSPLLSVLSDLHSAFHEA